MNVARLTNEVEAVSQIYASRYGIERDATWSMLKLQEEVGELTQAFLMLTARAREKGATPDLKIAEQPQPARVKGRS
jgi:NTP pyrophosphatase (non-canonical NTP hydrolase)